MFLFHYFLAQEVNNSGLELKIFLGLFMSGFITIKRIKSLEVLAAFILLS